jgi:3-oxoacyl-[acyl-carrier protein] reductase
MATLDSTVRRVVVTGGDSPVAVAIADRFAAEGADVTLVGSALGEGPEAPPGITRIRLDPAAADQIANLGADLLHRGSLDVLVTVPERHGPGGVAGLDAGAIDLATAHLLRAPMLYTGALLASLRQAPAPAIVHVAPVDAFMFTESALESALLNALVNYARQCVPQLPGIRINAACPGGAATPGQVASLVAFLASDRAGYMNSAVVTVDGGWYATHPRAMTQ